MVQVLVGILIVAVVLLALVRSLTLVSEQERESRAIREISNATVTYLIATGLTAANVDSGQLSAASQFRDVLAKFERQFELSSGDLKGNEAAAADAIAQAIGQRERTVTSAVIKAIEDGDLKRAQKLLDSPEAGRTNSQIGAATTVLLNRRVANQLKEEQETKDIAVYVAAAVLLAIASMTFVAAFFLLRIRQRVVPPLEDLDAAAVRVGEGDFRARARPAGTTETVRAGESFNFMAERVERNIAKLRELDVLKDEFVAAVSHDLRTPITVVRAYLDMYLDGEVSGPAEEKACFEVISRNVDELSELIDDLLTLTIIQAGGERAVHLQTVELDQLVEDVEREMRPTFEDAGVELEVRSGESIHVLADPLRVRQVIVNLLSNACKFSDVGTTVSLTAQGNGRLAEVSVEDHGIGIEREDLSHIGERFFRTKDAESVPGTGLGMAIVDELLKLHGSELKIESEPKVGSVFKFTLPLAA